MAYYDPKETLGEILLRDMFYIDVAALRINGSFGFTARLRPMTRSLRLPSILGSNGRSRNNHHQHSAQHSAQRCNR